MCGQFEYYPSEKRCQGFSQYRSRTGEEAPLGAPSIVCGDHDARRRGRPLRLLRRII